MEKVLRKRAWRDLKENKFRYFALAFLIIISMYLVISLEVQRIRLLMELQSRQRNISWKMDSFRYLCH